MLMVRKDNTCLRVNVLTKAYSLFSLALAILIAVNLAGYWAFEGFSVAVEKRAQTRQLWIKLEELLSTVIDAETSQRGYLLTQRQDYLEAYYVAVSRLDQQFTELKALGEEEKKLDLNLESLRALLNARIDHLKRVIQIAQTDGFATANEFVSAGYGKALMDQLRSDVLAKEGLLTAFLGQFDQATERRLARSRWVLAGGDAVSVLFLVFAFLQLRREIHRRAKAEIAVKGLNRELETQVAELERANKELESFSYSVSHDLRAPLRHINGFVNLLGEDGEGLNATQRRYLSIIANSARKMGQLIDGLLVFSRMSRTDLNKLPTDLGLLTEQAIRDLEPETKGRDIRWKIHPLPIVLADRTLLYQVLFNLISNAIKYTAPRDSAEVEIGSQEGRNQEVVVFIRDNGVGFDMRYVNKLFGVFQRLHGAEEFEGAGIGLANVRRIIQRHGGHTWAEGKLNEGATFYFALPKFPGAAPVPPATESDALSPGEGLRVSNSIASSQRKLCGEPTSSTDDKTTVGAANKIKVTPC